VRFAGRVARAWADDGRETLVAFCDVEGLAELYETLSAVAGRALPPPPAHVTLYTATPGTGGIGLATEEQASRQTEPLAPDDAAAVLASIRR